MKKNYDVYEMKVLCFKIKWARLTLEGYKPPEKARLIRNVWATNKKQAIRKAVWIDKI